MKAQQQVYENVVARGYRQGWEPHEFLARQFAKMTEELGEAALYIRFPIPICMEWRGIGTNSGEFDYELVGNGMTARELFDRTHLWHGMGSFHFNNEENYNALKDELTDMQVVLFQMAAMVEEITGQPFDVVNAAINKSGADVDRGVRSE